MAKKNNLVRRSKGKDQPDIDCGNGSRLGNQRIYGGSPEQCQKAERDGGKSRGIYTGQAVYTGR